MELSNCSSLYAIIIFEKRFEKAEESKIVEGFKLANENIEDAEIIEEEKPTT